MDRSSRSVIHARSPCNRLVKKVFVGCGNLRPHSNGVGSAVMGNRLNERSQMPSRLPMPLNERFLNGQGQVERESSAPGENLKAYVLANEIGPEALAHCKRQSETFRQN